MTQDRFYGSRAAWLRQLGSPQRGPSLSRSALSIAAAIVGIGLLSAPAPATADQNLPLVGGSGGTAQSQTCPAGSVMVGVLARVGAAIDAVGIRCRQLRTNGSIGTLNVDGNNMMGGGGGNKKLADCPSGHVVMGQFIASGGFPNTVHRLGLGCKLWDAGGRRVTGTLSTVKIETAFGATIGSSSGSSCSNTSEPVRRLRTRAGQLVDAAGLTCIRP